MHLNYFLLLGLLILFGGFSFTLYPLSITYTCDYFSSKKIIGLTVSLLIVYGIGCVIGPLLAPIAMHVFGPSGLFLYMSGLCLLFIILALWRVIHAKAVSEEEQKEYFPNPRTTSLAGFIDPRNADIDDEDEDDEEFEGDEYDHDDEI